MRERLAGARTFMLIAGSAPMSGPGGPRSGKSKRSRRGDRGSARQDRLADDLGAVHAAAQALVEGVAAMHDAAVVPHHQVAGAPLLVPGEAILGGMSPHGVEHRLALLDR